MAFLQISDKRIFISTLLFAVFANTAAITQILRVFMPQYENVAMTTLYMITIVAAIIMRSVDQRWQPLNVRLLFIVVVLVTYYVGTYAFIASPHTAFRYFFVFTICSLVMPSLLEIDVKLFLLFTIALTSPSVFFLNSIFELDENGYISMGISYAFLLPIIATFSYFLKFLKYESKIRKITFALIGGCSVPVAIQLLQYGSRGPVVSIIGCMCFYYIIALNKESARIRKVNALVLVIAALVLFRMFPYLLSSSYNFMMNHGLESQIIEKTYDLDQSEDMSNGRVLILNMAMEGIADKPLFGHGMDLFEYYTGYVYPHNFIVQMIYDMGLVVAFLIVIIIVKCMKETFDCFDYRYFLYIWTLFFASVPGAMFSDDLWNNRALWLFLGSLIKFANDKRYFECKSKFIWI